MSETIVAGGLEFFVENRRTTDDGGPSLQVLVAVGAEHVQLLRFDMFDKQPHYHYAPDGANIRYDLDPLTVDDGISWTIGLLREKLPRLLTKAGYESISADDAVAAAAALADVESAWRVQEPDASRD